MLLMTSDGMLYNLETISIISSVFSHLGVIRQILYMLIFKMQISYLLFSNFLNLLSEGNLANN